MRMRTVLEDRLNIGVNGDVRLREAADLVPCAGRALKVKEAADVVIFVERAEDALDFLARKAQRVERHGFSVATRNRQIFSNNFLQFHFSSPARTSDPLSVSSGYGNRLRSRLRRRQIDRALPLKIVPGVCLDSGDSAM